MPFSLSEYTSCLLGTSTLKILAQFQTYTIIFFIREWTCFLNFIFSIRGTSLGTLTGSCLEKELNPGLAVPKKVLLPLYYPAFIVLHTESQISKSPVESRGKPAEEQPNNDPKHPATPQSCPITGECYTSEA